MTSSVVQNAIIELEVAVGEARLMQVLNTVVNLPEESYWTKRF